MDLFKIGSVAIVFSLLLLFYLVFTQAQIQYYLVFIMALGFGMYAITRPPSQ